MPYRSRNHTADAATVAAVLLPRERSRVDAAGDGCFRVVHRDSVPDAIRVVRERHVDAFLVSVHHCRSRDLQALAHLVHDFPSIPTVALVSHHEAPANETLLHLGATGVQQVVDVTTPTGWQHLRQIVGQPASKAVARIQGPIIDALGETPPDSRLFFEALVRLAPETVSVRQLAIHLDLRPSTLMSRFGRVGLPSPKNYLAGIRLLHAALLFEAQGLSVADVAYRLEYSSPQSFGRHLRAMLGITATEFRRRFPFGAALGRFIDRMIAPYGNIWPGFRPLGGAAHKTTPPIHRRYTNPRVTRPARPIAGTGTNE
jgi:AraC-like DNA-binding protein